MARSFSSQALATGSILVALAVLCMKIVAWRLTGSVALYSDAMESFVNVAGAVLAWGAIWIAERPADKGTPLGITRQRISPRLPKAHSSWWRRSLFCRRQ